MSSHTTPVKRRSPELSSPSSRLDSVAGESISTFVFLKCNVTNINEPKLTELAMIAVNKIDVIHGGCGDTAGPVGGPRYRDTLVLAFDPEKSIDSQDSVNSNLTSEELRHSRRKPFGMHTVQAINNFLKKQRRPVCLLAHNGISVDFKVLRKEVKNLGMAIFGDDAANLLCADTLWIFYGIDHPAADEDCDGVRRMLFPQNNQQGNLYHRNQPTMLDYARYSFENVYWRFLRRFPDPNLRSAKYYAACLLDIFRNAPDNLLHLVPCQKFSSPLYGSPPKLSRRDSLSSQNHKEELVANQISEDPISDAIQTFVFLDLETTGLDPTACGIAEICMIAINRSQLSNIEINGGNMAGNRDIMPRVTDECSLIIRPLDDISNGASRINGLKTEELDARGVSSFTRRVTGILEDFVKRQVRPICLVAHNGENFDFPILDRHIRHARTPDQIWNDIHCADTILGLRQLVVRQSYALGRVYNDLAGHQPFTPPAHTAEGDVLRLISIVRLLPVNLLIWMEENKRLFRAN